jgi:hypothetical protein
VINVFSADHTHITTDSEHDCDVPYASNPVEPIVKELEFCAVIS